MRIESSIVTSLSELRAIEQQRIADERAAVEHQRRTEMEAREATLRAKREAEEARQRAERDEAMRIEQARLDAEREARMRVEHAEAAERARLAATLEEQRLAQEMELRRAEIAKKRPRWMLAVTGLALVAAAGLGWLAMVSAAERDAANEATIAAEHEKQAAQRRAQEAKQELDRLARELDGLDAQVARAEQVLLAAQTKADRDRAAAAIADANRLRAEVRRRQYLAEQRRLEQERQGGFDASKCLHGALDCIDGKPKKK